MIILYIIWSNGYTIDLLSSGSHDVVDLINIRFFMVLFSLHWLSNISPKRSSWDLFGERTLIWGTAWASLLKDEKTVKDEYSNGDC